MELKLNLLTKAKDSKGKLHRQELTHLKLKIRICKNRITE